MRLVLSVIVLFLLSSAAFPQTPQAKAKAAIAIAAACCHKAPDACPCKDCDCQGKSAVCACTECKCARCTGTKPEKTVSCACGCSCESACDCSTCDCGCQSLYWAPDGNGGYDLCNSKRVIGYLYPSGVYKARDVKTGKWKTTWPPIAVPSKPVSVQPVMMRAGGSC